MYASGFNVLSRSAAVVGREHRVHESAAPERTILNFHLAFPTGYGEFR